MGSTYCHHGLMNNKVTTVETQPLKKRNSLKEGNSVICNNMGKPGGHYTKRSKHRKTNAAWSDYK